MAQVAAGYRRAHAIHVVLGNLSAHSTTAVWAWYAVHQKVMFHASPTYNRRAVKESSASKAERDLIARETFASISDLGKKLLRYIRRHNHVAPLPMVHGSEAPHPHHQERSDDSQAIVMQ